jgi:Xaa-Pro aminopeptidase
VFDASLFSTRRTVLARRVASGCILLPGNEPVGMNYLANEYPFRQDGSFMYFCGLDTPGLCLWIDCDSGEERLFGAEPGIMDTVWSGPAPSLSELAERAGIAGHGDMAMLAELCRDAGAAGRRVHYLPSYRGDGVLRLSGLLGMAAGEIGAGVSRGLIDAVVELRSVKDPKEVAEIRRAVDLSAGMYRELMSGCRPGAREAELYGRMQGWILSHGSREAFPMILSRRGEVLHNHSRDQVLKDGDLLLVDSGVCSPGGYASDITRTLPVSGFFSLRQRDIYEIVLHAQAAAIGCMAPGVPFLECHLSAARVVAEGLTALGLMRGDPAVAVAAGAHALFFPHGLGHMLGLDVHDMESLGEDHVGYDAEFRRSGQFGLSGLRLARRLQPGFVVTVEPGIYFIPALMDLWRSEGRHEEFINYEALAAYRDFGGIRIEDDVLVTDDGADVLSSAIPKTVRELCDCMGRTR